MEKESENLFVARFIGTPLMNLIRGRINSGVSKEEAMRLEGLPDVKADAGEVVLRIRPNHVLLTEAERSNLQGRVFSMQCTGSGLQVTLKAGTMLAELMACPAIDETIGIRFERSWIHVLDVGSGRRVRMDVAGGRRA